jgi:hypothetical protein
MQRALAVLLMCVPFAVGCDDGGAPSGPATRDAERPDAAPMDATPPDAAPADASPTDASSPDAVPPDAAPADAAPTDAAPPDAAPDLGPPTPGDEDRDGYTVDEGDCDNANAAVFPGAPERCDALDNDCDGEVDGQVVSCFDGDPSLLGSGACLPGTRACTAGVEGPCVGQTLPRDEVCGDAIDDDCDGEADDGCDADGDGFTGVQGDCNDADVNINPRVDEVCDAIDNDCDGVVDLLATPCFDGPPGTLNVGVCRGGSQTCAAGVFGVCQGQVLPAAGEACGDGTDDDCDGRTDEGCEALDPACALIDLASPVTVTTPCVATGSEAQGLVVVQLRDVNGQALTNRSVEIQFQPALPLAFRNVLSTGGTYFRGFTPTELPQVSNAVVTVACGVSRVALRSRPEVRVVDGAPLGVSLITSGCPLSGDLRVNVTDAESGALIPNAFLMAGTLPENRLQENASDAIRGLPGARPNHVTAGDGRPKLLDYSGRLSGPTTVTVGANGYENVTLSGVNASALTVPLRRIAPEFRPDVRVEGRLTDFDSLRLDRQIDAGLVLRSFDLPFLTTFNLSRLFGRAQCWDPLQEGVAGGLVGETIVPGNLYVPRQRENLLLLPLTIAEHAFTLTPFAPGTDDIVGLTGKAPAQEVFDLLSSPDASLNELFSLLSLREIGVARNQRVEADVLDLTIPLSQPLVENAACSVDNAPPGTSVVCVAAGDWSGRAGAGRLFPMGFAGVSPAELDAARGPVVAPLTTVAPEGVFRGIGYVGAAVSLYLDPELAPPGQAAGISTVLDRGGLDADGGTTVADTFFDIPTVSRDGRSINWGAIENATSPLAQVCKVELVRSVRDLYDPGECVGAAATGLQLPLWTSYVRGDLGTIELPALPDSWPRAATGGVVDVEATPEEDRVFFRVSCLGLDPGSSFDFDRGDFRALVEDLTHITLNERYY